jgi:phenylpropionate dioxygenase-like ring-hydroxylating dioxygenase large terminal subunit
MSTQRDDNYIPGEFAIDPDRYSHPIERKSPPWNAFHADKDNYLLIEPVRYTGREHMEREWAKLWPRVWLCAGRVSDLPEVGSWLRFDIGPESIIVVRSAPDVISALYNTCQHRGNRLVDGDFGKVAAFVCPYHSWTYDLNGKCKRITDRKYFKPGALCGKLDAGTLRCGVWGGNVWVNMDEDAPPLSEYLNKVMAIFEPYQLEKMSVIRDVVVDLRCNWKVLLDAFSESYHVHMTHPEGMPVTEDLRTQIDFFHYGHSRQWVPIGLPSSRMLQTDSLNELQKFLLRDVGIDPETFGGRSRDVPDAIRRAKRQSDNSYGIDYSRYTDSQLTDTWAINVFPNMQCLPHPEGALLDRYLPHPDDPTKCRLHVMVLAPPLKPGKGPPGYMGVSADADTSGRIRPIRQYVSSDHPDLKSIIGEVLWQDVRNIEACQVGMRSRNFQAVRFSEQELRNQHQFAEIDRYLLDRTDQS